MGRFTEKLKDLDWSYLVELKLSVQAEIERRAAAEKSLEEFVPRAKKLRRGRKWKSLADWAEADSKFTIN